MRVDDITQEFVDKYAPLLSESICNEKHIHFNDNLSKAIVAWNLLNPDDPVLENAYTIGEFKEFFVLENGDIVDAKRSTYVTDMISALLDPERFRDILFKHPTFDEVDVEGPKYRGNLMYDTNLSGLSSVFEEMVNAANYLMRHTKSPRMKTWLPLIKAFSNPSSAGLNITTKRSNGEVISLSKEKDSPIAITDNLVIYSSGKAMRISNKRISLQDRYGK